MSNKMVSEGISGNWPLVSIIILNHNGKDYLKKCLESVLNTNYPNFEIILVDNASTDGSAEYAEKIAKNNSRIKLIRSTVNLGFAEGNNVGVRNSNGKYIAFLNNDTVVDPNWLFNVAVLLERDKSIGAVQSLLLSRDGSKVDSIGGVIDILGTAEERIKFVNNALAKGKRVTEEVFSACAAAMVVRKSLFKEVGGFDPKFFAYFEDVDLSWRIRLLGYRVVLCPNSIVYHIRGATSKKFGKRIFDFHLYKNQIAMLIKNYHLKNILKVMPVVILLYMFRVMNGLIENDADLAIAPLRALYWNIKELGYLLQQRCLVQRKVRRVSDDCITKMMIKIPMQFVLCSRKRHSDIK